MSDAACGPRRPVRTCIRVVRTERSMRIRDIGVDDVDEGNGRLHRHVVFGKVEPVEGVAAAARLTLVAAGGAVVEVVAPCPLHHVANRRDNAVMLAPCYRCATLS